MVKELMTVLQGRNNKANNPGTLSRVLLVLQLSIYGVSLAGCGSNAPGTSQEVPSSTAVVETVETKQSPIMFHTLEKGESYIAETEGPALFVSGSLTEAIGFESWLESIDELQDVDFDNSLVIAVWSGMYGSSGYGITVVDIESAGKTVTVTAELSDPSPGQMTSDVISFPYHLVQVARTDVGLEPGAQWILLDIQGNQLAQTNYP